jgi:hypothetical protein
LGFGVIHWIEMTELVSGGGSCNDLYNSYQSSDRGKNLIQEKREIERQRERESKRKIVGGDQQGKENTRKDMG